MPDDKLDHPEDRERSKISGQPLARLASDYAEAALTTVAKANREFATATELRSARGMCIGALAGVTLVLVLLALVGDRISPPISVVIVMIVSGLGWAESRYRGRRHLLSDQRRALADESYHIYTRKLRAIEDRAFPTKQARALREQAYGDFGSATRTLSDPDPDPAPDPTEPHDG